MEFIFSLEQLESDDFFTERGVYIHDAVIGLYYGIITEQGLPQTLQSLKPLLHNHPFAMGKSVYEKEIYCFPTNKEIANRAINSYLKKTGNNCDPVTTKEIETTGSLFKASLLSPESAAEMLHDKKVLIFTGAGISVASGVPDMMKLEELADEIFNPIDEYILEVIEKKSLNRLSKAKELLDLFVHSEPSKAHFKIAELYNLYGYKLLTGNIDGLHEKTGIQPSYYTSQASVINGLDKYDFLITIGLGDEGNIGLTDKFRLANPQGTVIAINIEGPKYLTAKDLLIAGDCNEILEELCKALKNKQTCSKR